MLGSSSFQLAHISWIPQQSGQLHLTRKACCPYRHATKLWNAALQFKLGSFGWKETRASPTTNLWTLSLFGIVYVFVTFGQSNVLNTNIFQWIISRPSSRLKKTTPIVYFFFQKENILHIYRRRQNKFDRGQ